MNEHDKLFINGEWVAPEGKGVIEVISPHTEEVIGTVPNASTADIDKAIAAARNAFDNGPWSQMSPAERGEGIKRLSAALSSRAQDIADLISAQNGLPPMKPLEEILGVTPPVPEETEGLLPLEIQLLMRERINEIGTASAHNNYPWGWTMAGNTPLRRWKREVHEGGVADPCVMRWPRGISTGGEIRHQFTHAIDILPTLLDLVGISTPTELRGVEQTPIEGTSFSYLLNNGNAPGRHTTQYFEIFGSRAIYHDGWKAVTFKPLGHMYDDGIDPDAPFEDDVWELYHVAKDFSECTDLAASEPDRLGVMVERWWEEARQHQVLPLDNRPLAALLNPRRPFAAARRAVFWPGGEVLPEQVGISVYRRNHTITVPILVSDDLPPEGVLLALGTVLGGWSLHILNGRLRYASNYLGRDVTVIETEKLITAGEHLIEFSFIAEGEGGTVTLSVDGELVGSGTIERVTLYRHSISGAGYTCGWEQGPAVGSGYSAPFRCTAQIQKVIVETEGPMVHEPEAEFEAIMAEQ